MASRGNDPKIFVPRHSRLSKRSASLPVAAYCSLVAAYCSLLAASSFAFVSEASVCSAFFVHVA